MKIFLDVDGVLCNLNKEFMTYNHLGIENFKYAHGEVQMWIALSVLNYKDLPLLPWAKKLYKACRRVDPHLRFITSCYYGSTVMASRKQWLERHFGEHEVIFTKSKRLFSEDGALLIDDCFKNREEWRELGGKALPVSDKTSAKYVISLLEEMI